MSYLFLVLAKLASMVKVIAVKNCGTIAKGPKNSIRINLIRSLGCILVGSVVCIFSGFAPIDKPGIIISVISGISNATMLFAWILATASAPIYFIEVFCMIGGVLMPMLLSPFLLDESIGPVQWVGAVLLVFAAFFLSKRGGGRITLKTVLLATMAGLGNMGSTLTMKLFNIHSIGTVADFQLYTYVVCSVTLALVLLFFAIYEHYAIKKGSMKPDQKASPIRGKVLIFIGIAIVMMYAAQYLSTLSAKGVPAAVFYPLSYVITMPLVYLVDVLIYKERVTARGIIGIVIVTVSGILINLKLS